MLLSLRIPSGLSMVSLSRRGSPTPSTSTSPKRKSSRSLTILDRNVSHFHWHAPMPHQLALGTTRGRKTEVCQPATDLSAVRITGHGELLRSVGALLLLRVFAT